MSVKQDIKFRVYLTFTGILMLALAILGKVLYIQYVKGDELRQKAKQTHIKEEVLVAERGNIYTEDGTILAATIPQFDLAMDLGVVVPDTFKRYVDSLADGLANLFKDKSAREYKAALKNGFSKKKRYWVIQRNAPYYQYQAARELPILNKKKGVGGLIADVRMKRNNPYGILAFRTIGLWRESGKSVGLEYAYDSVLAGKPGFRTVRKTTGGVYIPIEGSEIDPVNGKDIVTTIDINIQDIAEHALLDVLSKYESAYGSVIVMETETGKIRAMANLKRQENGRYTEDYNYALLKSEPGSTFKLFSLLALLDDGYVTINDKVNVEGGRKRFGKITVRDDHGGMNEMTIKKALAVSSNVAYAKLVDQYYHNKPMKYIQHLQKFGLDKKTGIDLAGEGMPLIKTTSHKHWNKSSSLAQIAYGYESLITPLHILMVYNAVANGGKLMKPYLVSEVREYGNVLRKIEPTVLNKQIARPEAIQQAMEALKSVVEEGTARSIQSPFYSVGGKTGTAQVADKGITYKDGVKQGSFVGFFPLDNPQYTIMVLARSKPFGTYYGATIGAPVFKAVADKLYANHIGGWNVPIDSITNKKGLNQVITTSIGLENIFQSLGWNLPVPETSTFAKMQVGENKKIEILTKEYDKKKIPNVAGMGLKDALYLLESMGLRVTISGTGKVKSQSVPDGSVFTEGQKIHLVLG